MLSKTKILLLFLWVLTPANAGIVPLGAAQQCPLSLAPLYERELGLLCSLDEPDANQSQPLPAVPPSVPASWQQGSVCHGSGEDKFCGFTKKSFGGGEGVSLITTLERIASLASGQLSDAAEPAHGPARPGAEAAGAKPYVEAEIPGKGVGLVASGPIRTGQLVMARTPAVMVDGRALQAMGEDEMGELLGGAVAGLPAPHRARYLNLTTHSSVRSHRERVRNIFGVNRFRTRILDGGPDFHAVFTEISRLNHECRPNCAYYFDPATLTQKVHAVRDILPGEELTVSYIDGFQESKARQRQLHEFWGFQCSCRLCMAESHLVEESDSRIAQVKKLWSELDDYSATSTATPEKAELLIQLYQLEGLDGRLQEAYYRAAIEWSGVGNAVQAVKYARLCLQSGLTFKGPGKPFIVSMQELVKDPEAHRTWRSRIRDTSMAEQK